MALMGKKLTAAQALEGTFSSEGLAALAGEDANVEMALARSLVERMDEGDVRRLWKKAIPAAPSREDVPEHILPFARAVSRSPIRKPQHLAVTHVAHVARSARACGGLLF